MEQLRNRIDITVSDDVMVTITASKQDQLVNGHFSVLAALLQRTPLPTASGSRVASASEFMLMEHTEQCAKFKHRETRNYVLVWYSSGNIRLVVPRENVPFHGGEF